MPPTPDIVLVFVRRVNFVKPVCDNLIGKHHTLSHRFAVGVALMFTGVFIAKYFGHSSYEFVAYLGDTIGYALHGVGLIPFIERILELTE